jgi:hypothetical protein
MLGYRTVFRAQDRPARVLDQSVAEFRRWLSTKSGARYNGDTVELGVTTEFAHNARALLIDDCDDHGVRSVRATLSEENEAGRWKTTLTATDPAEGDPWVWIDVEGPAKTSDGSAPQWTSTPGLAKALLGIVDACDGVAELNKRPKPVSLADIDHLVEVVCDADRRGLALLNVTDLIVSTAFSAERTREKWPTCWAGRRAR